MQIGNILKALRVESEMTQTQLSKKLNIGQSTIVGYEKNEREPTISNLIQYARFFNVSLDYLTGLEDDFGTKTTAPTENLTADDLQLINKIRALPKESRALIEQMVDTLSNTDKTVNKKQA